MLNTLKTTLLLTAMTVLFMAFGLFFGGRGGALLALLFAGGMNFFLYWYSDKLILSRYNAEEVTAEEAPELHRIVSNLAEKAGIPKPKIHLIPEDKPNAFATGRNPANASVAVTRGLLNTLGEDELEGVLAHELSHVFNRDTLISVIAATIAGAISFLATIARWGAIFGGRGGRQNNIFVVLAMSIIAPLAATVIQLAISRGREHKADRSAAKLTGRPKALASALKRLEAQNNRGPAEKSKGDQQTAHLFIVNPLSGEGMSRLFSTHPSVEERIERLNEMAGGV